jgi:uncharacterized membrane protein YuzA (DUF378 family)
MAKFFGLFLFINIFVVGIMLGSSQHSITPRIIYRILGYFLAVYSAMALYLVYTTDFLVPH